MKYKILSGLLQINTIFLIKYIYIYIYLKSLFRIKGDDILKNGYPKIFNKKLVTFRNLCIALSIIIEKSILYTINNIKCLRNGEEDYDCWLRVLDYTDVVFVNKVRMYYNLRHCDSQNYYVC